MVGVGKLSLAETLLSGNLKKLGREEGGQQPR